MIERLVKADEGRPRLQPDEAEAVDHHCLRARVQGPGIIDEPRERS
jgi:hypothetical protein